MCIILQYLSGFAIRSIKCICVCPNGAVTCSTYSVTIFSFARFLPSFFNKLGCTAKITSICCERLQMLMFAYCGKFQMLMCFYCGELQMLMHIGLQMLMHIYCGGLQMPHGDKPMDFASSSVTSVSLFQGPTARPVIFLAGCSDMDHRLAV